MKPYINDMKERFVATFSDILRDRGVFPGSVDDIHAAGQLADPRVVQAKAMYRHIEILEGLSTSAGFRKATIITADYAERNLGKTGGVLAAGLRSIADNDPVGFVRARNFELNLATNPLRQLLIQPSQTLNMVALSGTHFVTDFRRGRLVSKLANKRADVIYTDAELSSAAKTLNMSVEELRADVRSFRRSGGGAAVTSHETARDASKGITSKPNVGVVGKTLGAPVDALRAGVGFLGKGFNRGEEINIGVHWQVAKRRWIKANPNKSPYDVEAEFAITGEARSLALSMTQTGDFAYQKGLASIMTQYAAVQHKQLLLMTTSQALTRTEKNKIIALQLAMWGPSGIGLGAVWNKAAGEAGINTNEGLMNVIEDGAAEWMMNDILSRISGEDVDIDFSSSLAAASGINDNVFTSIGEMLIDGETADLYKIALGPTKSNYNRFADAADTIAIMYNTEDKGWEEISLTKDVVLKLFSGGHQATKALLARKMGYWTNNAGEALFNATDMAIFAKGVFGLNSNKFNDHYDTKLLKRLRDDEIREIADSYYKHVLSLSSQFKTETKGVDNKQLSQLTTQYKQFLRIQNAMINAHEEDAPIIFEAVQNKIKGNIGKVGQDELMNVLHKMIMKEGVHAGTDYIVQRAVNAGVLEEKDVDSIKQFVSTMLGDKE